MKMKLNSNIFLLVMTSLFLTGCSASRYNTKITSSLPVEKLKKDIDEAQGILVKYKPKLDWYITTDSLNAKFDTLRNSISSPITSGKLFENLSPVIYSVRQGHDRLRPALLKLTSQQKAIRKGKKAPLAQFEYLIDDNRLFIAKNLSADSTIQAGTEIIAINGESAQEIIQRCYSLFASDGYNTTFFPRFTAVNFQKIYATIYPEWKDSIRFSFQRDANVREVYVKSIGVNTKQKNPTSRELSFLTPDSTIAFLCCKPNFRVLFNKV